jgi:hypothetical protein
LILNPESGPVVLQPDFSKLKVVGLTHDLAESYAPINITVFYAGQYGTAQAISDDHRLDQGREGVEGRLGDHPASPTGASRRALSSPDANGDRVSLPAKSALSPVRRMS